MEIGSVVKSAYGHDKDRFYVVVGLEKERLLIADGKRRKLEKPKAKSARHVCPTKSVVGLEAATNKRLRELLRPFNGDPGMTGDMLAGKEEGGN